MIILLSKNKALVKRIKSIENVKLVTNMFDCETFLSIPDMECDLLILDYKLVSECYHLFFDWIIENNLFIKNILIYYAEDDAASFTEDFHLELDKLKEEKYPNALISINKLVDAIKTL